MTPTQPPFPFPVGFHYFCDHRCWRCQLSARCPVFTRWQKLTKRRKVHFSGPAGRVASVLAVSVEVTIEEAAIVAAEIERTMPLERKAIAEAMEPATLFPESDAGRNARQDQIVAIGAEYAQSCWPALQALRPLLQAKGDPVAVDACERLEEMCATIASKVFRAISGSFNVGTDPNDTQSDANGSAKVGLLLIEESRQAWRELMKPGRAIADGLPARFIAMLDALEAGILKRFPRAFEFIRPGFDTGLAGEDNAQLANAMRASAGTTQPS